MAPDEVARRFEEAQRRALHQQALHAECAQQLGQIAAVFGSTKPYWETLAQSGSNAASYPLLISGYNAAVEMDRALVQLETEKFAFADVRSLSVSAVSFGSNTVAAAVLHPLSSDTTFNAQIVPVADFRGDDSLVSRLGNLDPALGRVTREIWECLYGTVTDPERAAMYMVRQTWDHLFTVLAPDEEVRASQFWKRKEEPKPLLVTRDERMEFAIDRHVHPSEQARLKAATKQMKDLYGELNRAHERQELNRDKALKSLHAVYSWLAQWADAIEKVG